jgi:hypothetical protein
MHGSEGGEELSLSDPYQKVIAIEWGLFKVEHMARILKNLGSESTHYILIFTPQSSLRL